MTEDIDKSTDGGAQMPAKEESEADTEKIVQDMTEFLEGQDMFKGPDRDLMLDHTMEPRTERQEAALASLEGEDVTRMVVQNRLRAISDEAMETARSIAASPSVRWGDLVCGVMTREGDMAVASSAGVLLFLAIQSPPIKWLMRRWRNEDDYEINEGDIFHHNDARYGQTHNPDLSTYIPVFDDDELVAWVAIVCHEGEIGATEAGGMPTDAESPYDEGLKIPPMKIGTDYELDDELMNFFQNSVRDKKMMKADHQMRLAVGKNMIGRIDDVIDEYGSDAFVGTLRHALESADEEARSRIRSIPDGTYTTANFVDSNLKDDLMLKIPLEMTVDEDEITLDFRGAAPALADRPTNTQLASVKGQLVQTFISFLWPDMPTSQGVLEPVKFKASDGSIVDPPDQAPNAQCMQTFFDAHAVTERALQFSTYGQFVEGNNAKITDAHANHYTNINCVGYGGFTQHGDQVGNVLTDLNAAPGGARWNRDGVHSQTSPALSMGDTGEGEKYEEEYPLLLFSRNRITKDIEGFGKYRGGHGHHQVLSHKDTPFWAWQMMGTGSRFPRTWGLYGGYGGPVYPTAKIEGSNLLEEMEENPEDLEYDIQDIMKKKPFDGEYSTWDFGRQTDIADEGEIYLSTQGAGGGMGDPLGRDPDSVVGDMKKDLISEWTAENIYAVSYDEETGRPDAEETEKLREQERERRLEEGVPYDEFIEDWENSSPPEDIPYFGSWDSKEEIYRGPHMAMPTDQIQPVTMSVFRENNPELFDTPVYPPKAEWKGDVEGTDVTGEVDSD
jgi:N-methylhydantoinase B/oxoprolinase/acetone carboxylase alpha subunit